MKSYEKPTILYKGKLAQFAGSPISPRERQSLEKRVMRETGVDISDVP